MSSHLDEAVHFHSEFDREYRILRPRDREKCWVHGRGRFELDEHGRPIMMRGTTRSSPKENVWKLTFARTKNSLTYSFSMHRRPSPCSIERCAISQSAVVGSTSMD